MISAHLMRLRLALDAIDSDDPICSPLTAPLTLVNITNRREHHMARAKRTKSHRDAIALLLARQRPALRAFLARHSLAVRLLRVYSGRDMEFDDDGLHGAMKAVRDGVATALGVDDRDPRVTFVPEQRRGTTTCVEISFFEVTHHD